MIRNNKSKIPVSLIEETQNRINLQLELYPVLVPNKTLLKWVEMYANNCFVKIEESLQRNIQYKVDMDIYHQDFHLILTTVNSFLHSHNCSTLHEWMDRGMQDDLIKINQSLLPNRFNRKNRK